MSANHGFRPEAMLIFWAPVSLAGLVITWRLEPSGYALGILLAVVCCLVSGLLQTRYHQRGNALLAIGAAAIVCAPVVITVLISTPLSNGYFIGLVTAFPGVYLLRVATRPRAEPNT